MEGNLLVILFAIISFIISSVVHELGHIIVGIKEGFKFNLFIVGPFGFKRNERDKIVFYIEKDVSLWGGLSSIIPINEDLNNFNKFGRILLGGPIASIVFGAICLPLGILTDNIFLLFLGAMPLGMGVATLIPARNGAFYTDGGRWLRMHRNEETKAMELAIWKITQNAIIEGNFSKASLDDIHILINSEDIRTSYIGHYYAYCYYKDNNDSSNVEKEKLDLERLKKKVPKQMVSMFKVE